MHVIYAYFDKLVCRAPSPLPDRPLATGGNTNRARTRCTSASFAIALFEPLRIQMTRLTLSTCPIHGALATSFSRGHDNTFNAYTCSGMDHMRGSYPYEDGRAHLLGICHLLGNLWGLCRSAALPPATSLCAQQSYTIHAGCPKARRLALRSKSKTNCNCSIERLWNGLNTYCLGTLECGK